MDFPAEATVCLDLFRDERKVRELLRSHDFVVRDLDRNQLRAKGSFLKLRAVKGRLEQLLNAERRTETTSPPQSSSGAVPKHRSGSGGHRGRLGSSDASLHAPPSSPNPAPSPGASGTSHSPPHSSSSPGTRQPDVRRQGGESFIVDADVFKYAKKLRQKDIGVILENHNVKMVVDKVGDSVTVMLQGRSTRAAASKLQSLLSDLATSLRTQEVPRTDLDREGAALLEKIRRNESVYNSVLVCETEDGLHLIGPSSESYEVKQMLRARAGRAGGPSEGGGSRSRSSSLPPGNRRSSAVKDSGAFGYSSAAGAAGYSPSKYQDYTREGAAPSRPPYQRGATSSRCYTLPPGAHRGATGNTGLTPRMKQLLETSRNEMKQKFKQLTKK